MRALADSDSSNFTLQVFQFEWKLQNKTPAHDLPPPTLPEDIVPIHSTTQSQGTHRKGWGRPRTLWLKYFTHFVADLYPDSCLTALLSVRDTTI